MVIIESEVGDSFEQSTSYRWPSLESAADLIIRMPSTAPYQALADVFINFADRTAYRIQNHIKPPRHPFTSIRFEDNIILNSQKPAIILNCAAMESTPTRKWHLQLFPVSLRFVAMLASLAAVICFGYSQGLHDTEVVEVADLGHHVVTPATGTVS